MVSCTGFVGVFHASDPVTPLVAQQLCTFFNEHLLRLLLLVLVHLLPRLGRVVPALDRSLQPGLHVRLVWLDPFCQRVEQGLLLSSDLFQRLDITREEISFAILRLFGRAIVVLRNGTLFVAYDGGHLIRERVE